VQQVKVPKGSSRIHVTIEGKQFLLQFVCLDYISVPPETPIKDSVAFLKDAIKNFNYKALAGG
jgi:hypothetical protein